MSVQPQGLGERAVPGVCQSLPAIALNTLSPHQAGTIISLKTASDPREQSMVLRLMEIGFLPGEQVRVLATGFPGADPLAIRVGQATFALRRDEAAFVLVQPVKS